MRGKPEEECISVQPSRCELEAALRVQHTVITPKAITKREKEERQRRERESVAEPQRQFRGTRPAHHA